MHDSACPGRATISWINKEMLSSIPSKNINEWEKAKEIFRNAQ